MRGRSEIDTSSELLFWYACVCSVEWRWYVLVVEFVCVFCINNNSDAAIININ